MFRLDQPLEPRLAPLRQPVHVPPKGRALAAQISANLMEMGVRHSLGVVVSRTGDAWLISPDIRENNGEFEARYYGQYATWGRLDMRFRDRQDLRLRRASTERRRDQDVYVRTTMRF